MDNLISSIITVSIFLAFVIGLAVSIGKLPFAIIVGFVCCLILTDFYQSAKQGLKEEKENNT